MIDVGSVVRYTRYDDEEMSNSGYYPPYGTLGVVRDADLQDYCIEWDSGTMPGAWWCRHDAVTEMPQDPRYHNRTKE